MFFSEKWENHADVEMVRWIQARNQKDDLNTLEYVSSEDDDTDNEKEPSVNATIGNSSGEDNDMIVANKFSALSTEQ